MTPTAYERGRAAARQERPITENPYKAARQRGEWLRGHTDGEDPDRAQVRHRQAEQLVARGRPSADVLAEFASFYPRYCSVLTADSLHRASPPSFDLCEHSRDDFACARCGVDQRLVACDCRPHFGSSDTLIHPWVRRVWARALPRVKPAALLGGVEEWGRLRLACTQGLALEVAA